MGHPQTKLNTFDLVLAICYVFNEIVEMFVKDIRCDINTDAPGGEHPRILAYVIENKASSVIEAMLDFHRLKKIGRILISFFDYLIEMIDKRLANRIKNELYDEIL